MKVCAKFRQGGGEQRNLFSKTFKRNKNTRSVTIGARVLALQHDSKSKFKLASFFAIIMRYISKLLFVSC